MKKSVKKTEENFLSSIKSNKSNLIYWIAGVVVVLVPLFIFINDSQKDLKSENFLSKSDSKIGELYGIVPTDEEEEDEGDSEFEEGCVEDGGVCTSYYVGGRTCCSKSCFRAEGGLTGVCLEESFWDGPDLAADEDDADDFCIDDGSNCGEGSDECCSGNCLELKKVGVVGVVKPQPQWVCGEEIEYDEEGNPIDNGLGAFCDSNEDCDGDLLCGDMWPWGEGSSNQCCVDPEISDGGMFSCHPGSLKPESEEESK